MTPQSHACAREAPPKAALPDFRARPSIALSITRLPCIRTVVAVLLQAASIRVWYLTCVLICVLAWVGCGPQKAPSGQQDESGDSLDRGQPISSLRQPYVLSLRDPSAGSDLALRFALHKAQQQPSLDHAVNVGPTGMFARVSEKAIEARFDESGVELLGIDDPSVSVRLHLTSVDRSNGTSQRVPHAKPQIENNTVRWVRPLKGAQALESWSSGPLGFEHQITLTERPQGQGIVSVCLDVTGAQPKGRDRVILKPENAEHQIELSEYYVFDAKGKILNGHMRSAGSQIFYDFDDSDAQYPVTIDPVAIVQQAGLAPGRQGNGQFGMSIAISLDGSTALVGAPLENCVLGNDCGAVYVFMKSGPLWAYQAKITPSDPAVGDQFGNSVALSNDGSTALIGVQNEDTSPATDNGATYVYTRIGTGANAPWIQEAKLLASDRASGDGFGSSVSISSDGNTAVIGAAFEDTVFGDNGAVYVFTRTGNSWMQSQKLVGAGNAYNLGAAVAISGDGTTLLLGASGFGAAYFYTKPGALWTLQGTAVPSGGGGVAYGQSVALSNDGNTALVGAPNVADTTVDPATSQSGAAFVFTRSGSVWSQQDKLQADDRVANARMGNSVALSADGNTALVGDRQRVESGFIPLGASYVFTRTGSVWSQQAKLTAADAENSDDLGSAVALSGDGNVALVGVPLDDEGGFVDTGSVDLFTRSGSVWTERTKYYAAEIWTPMQFGDSVCLSADGNTAAVSASLENEGASTANGAVYIFVRSGLTWDFEAKLLASDKANSDYFGSSISLSQDGNTALIGAYYEDDSGTTDNGAAYVFTRAAGGWTQQAKLLAADKANNDRFGVSVALSHSGDVALIGAYLEDDSGTINNGAAYVFVRAGSVWSQQSKLNASDKVTNDNFGKAVALSSNGTVALIGAIGSDDSGTTNNGSAYVFTQNAGVWSQEAKLLANDKTNIDALGNSVALSGQGDVALVGASQRTESGLIGAGAVYVFGKTANTWAQESKLLAVDKAAADNFGTSVSISEDGHTALIGSPYSDGSGTVDSGGAYLFSQLGASWTQTAKIVSTPKGNSDFFGTSVSLAADANTALVGAPRAEPVGATDSGFAFVFTISGINGDSCAINADCATGFCTDGFCCDTACSGACDVCSAVLGATVNGQCTPVAAGTPGTPVCSGFVLCDGVSGSCPAGCSIDAECNANQYCDNTGACVSRKNNGQSCAYPQHCNDPANCHECQSGNCVDGVCCNTECTEQCDECTTGVCLVRGHGVQGVPDCGNYACDGVNASCPSTCADSTDCADVTAFACVGSVCKAKLADGQACATANECSSGYCVDFVCCDTLCDGLCSACRGDLKEMGSSGTCGPALHGTNPRGLCAQHSAANPCGEIAACSNDGTCAKEPTSTGCGNNSCSGGLLIGNHCDGFGMCISGSSVDCSPYLCNIDHCTSPCSVDEECVDNYQCVIINGSGVCVKKGENGTGCSTNNDCTSNFCVDGICCDTGCNNPCQACVANLQQPGGTTGVCSWAAENSDPHDRCATHDGTEPCGLTGVCGAQGQCAYEPQTTGCGTNTCSGTFLSGSVCNGLGECLETTTPVDCSPYQCVINACATPCETDDDCVDGYRCLSNGICSAKKNLGEGCSASDECDSSFCVDSVCCDSPCADPCQYCANSGSVGQCSLVNGGQPKGSRPHCLGVNTTCGGECKGDSSQCTYPAQGTTCSNGDLCDGDSAFSGLQCDGAGQCIGKSPKSCAPFTCDPDNGTCKTACVTVTDCSEGATCSSSGLCTLGTATCSNKTTITQADGSLIDCSPFICQVGQCTATCSANSDCASTALCTNGQCVDSGGLGGSSGSGGSSGASGTSATGNSAAPKDDGGCGCRTVNTTETNSAAWVGVALVCMLGIRRRRAS